MYSGVNFYLACRSGPKDNCRDWEGIERAFLITDVAIIFILMVTATLAILTYNGISLGWFSQLRNLRAFDVKILWISASGILALDIVMYIIRDQAAHTPKKEGLHQVFKPIKAHKVHLAKKKKEARVEQQQKLKMMTFNVSLLPQWVGHLQSAANAFSGSQDLSLAPNDKRVPVIGQKLVAEKPDIFCGQESFCLFGTQTLTDTLVKGGYNVVNCVGEQTAFSINSGLIFATPHLIQREGIRVHGYTNLAGEDAASSKALLRVPVNIPYQGQERTVIFYTTHLQAKSGKEYDAIRKQQLMAILACIQKDQKANPTTPIILQGDLNVEYNADNQEFFGAFHDFYATAKGSKPKGSIYDMTCSGGTTISMLLDYCLLYKPRNIDFSNLHSSSSLNYCMEESSFSPTQLSDHLPLVTEVSSEQLLSYYQ